MSGTRQLAAIAMVAVMVLASGCAGWGTDGPDDGVDTDDAGDDLEEADGEAEADEGGDDPAGGDSNDTDGAAVDENGTDGDEEGSDGDETDAGTTGGDQDERTEDSGSSDSDSEQDQDGEKDTDESEGSDQDEKRETDEKKETDENGESDQDKEQDSGDETHTLRVGLIDATAAGPIAGTVTVDGETKEATPDEPAEFELEDGTYTVSGEYEEGWHVQSEEIEIDGEDVETNLHTVPVRTLTVETGEPDVDVTVERDDGETLSGTTGEDGTVTFETIPGSHTIDADGYERTQFAVPADFDPDPVVLEPTDDDGDETHTLTVTVTDPDGEPVTDEMVHIVTYEGGADVASAPTDDDGTVQFDLENGEYEVAVSAPDQDLQQPSDQRLVTIDGDDEEFNVQLEPSGGDETHTLTVTIIDRTAAGPMDGTATVDGETKDVVGDEGAEFDVDDGTYTVTGEASIDGWHVGSEEVTIDGGDEEVSLPAYPIRTVTVDTGEAGIDVTLADEDGNEVEMKTTGDDGRVEFSALPGNYSLHADGYESTDVTVPADQNPGTVTMHPETVTHTLTINNAGTSTVEIERQGGPDQDPETSTHDPVGGVVEAEVEEGSYHIRTDDRNDTMVAIHVDEDTEITLQDPNPDPITIEVVDADTGEGIEGAEISGVCDMWYSSGDDYITGETGPDGIAEAEPGLSPTNCNANINAEGYEEEVVQLSVPVDDGLVVELTPEQNGGGNGDVTCEDDFDSHHEAQSYFEEAPLERGHLDEDNDGVACEDHTSPDAKAIVIVEDEDGNPVPGETVMIAGESVETNEAGVASMTFDFGGESGSETVDISVRDEETTLTVENDQGGYLDEKSNIVEITVGPAGAQGSMTAVAA